MVSGWELKLAESRLLNFLIHTENTQLAAWKYLSLPKAGVVEICKVKEHYPLHLLRYCCNKLQFVSQEQVGKPFHPKAIQ